MLDERVRGVLRRLEAEDEREREAGLPVERRSRAVAPTTGAFLYTLAAAQPGAEVLEVGGSRGYSTIWLAAGARLLGGLVTSLEADPEAVARATRNVEDAGLGDWVQIVPGDARETIPTLGGPYDLVFLDADKAQYERYFELVRAQVEPGAIVVADNVHSHADVLRPYCEARQADASLVSITVPLDRGLELTSVLAAPL